MKSLQEPTAKTMVHIFSWAGMKYYCQEAGKTASYLGGPWFRFQFGDQLSRLRTFLVFHGLPRKSWEVPEIRP
jgi:hypothetical protein